MRLIRNIVLITLQLGIVIYLTLLAKRGLETVYIPDVFKNLSIIELEELDAGLFQAASDLKNNFLSSDTQIDSNIIIINIEAINPVQRGKIAKTIEILKDHGAKTIALSFYLDQSYDDIDPTWDPGLANAIRYKEENVIGSMVFQYFIDADGKEYDTTLIPPIDIFDGFYSVGYSGLERTAEKEGGIVQKFYPNIEYEGEDYKSFALATAYHFDSLNASVLKDERDDLYINFYKQQYFKIWDMSWFDNPYLFDIFTPLIKDKLFIIGYVTPYDEPVRTFMESTPIGKLDFCLVQACIINDILSSNFAIDLPFWLDMIVGACWGLFNILFYLYASRKNLIWEKFTSGFLLIIEIVINYVVVLVIFMVFNYKFSVAVSSLVIMISVPLNNLIHKKFIPLFHQMTARVKYSSVPYYLLHQFKNLFKTEKRSTRHLSIIFGFQRILWLYSAFKQNVINEKPEVKNIEETGINDMLPQIFKEGIHSHYNITKEYYSLFTSNNLKREVFRRIDAETDIAPNKDKFKEIFPFFVELMKFVSKELYDYQFIYTIKKTENKYLIIKFSTHTPKPEYLFLDQELPMRTVFLNKKGTYEFINMSPFIYYKQCKYHKEKEFFLFSNIQYDDFNGKKRLNYVGEQFMCSPTSPPQELIAYE